ncbi:glucose-1-phosphate adenylyltransferase [Nocardioides scoriae]|uniref:Glucose-1-phosphate adenylyltransferase n=1 Tax=Nocardioides scoriae TaxID=642780 RepID=A0A1H1W987_9ACTN|nr:sugar phosphate nucleotidyltransferase [Nocardioides scoriae]SDS93006.1 glucose-1-phosphate adenylyltransferase [Nocardioides scoriae]
MELTTTPRVLAIIQAGGAGGRMDVLTAERAKPALPFAGSYQLLDFPLSNIVNSGISDVWLSVQYQAESLEEQVRNGRPWDLDRTRGGLRLLVPRQGSGSLDEEGFAQGNADELYRLRDDLRRAAPDVVLVMSADHVYRFDYRELVATHLEKDAEVTMLVTDLAGVHGEDPADHAVVEVNRLGRVTGFAYKPESPSGSLVATEVFAYRTGVLVELLEELHRSVSGADSEREAGDSGLGDFGDLLVPRLVERGAAYSHRLEGYWRDLGQPHHYLNAHLELLADETDLFEGDWPVRTQQPERRPAYVAAGAQVADSLLSAGSHVSGTVTRSVLGPDVVVEAGAEVVESVVSAGTVVRSGATVTRTIVDTACDIGGGAHVGGPDTALDDPDAITILGRDAQVSGDVAPGGRVPPGGVV